MRSTSASLVLQLQTLILNLYENAFSLYRRLTPDKQATLDDLTTDALVALTKKDTRAMVAVHLRVPDALVNEGRAACTALGVAYPIREEGDARLRQLLKDAWPFDPMRTIPTSPRR